MTPALFTRQIAAELRKVIWPTRNELVTYTVVAMVFVIIMTAIVTSLDFGFTKLVLAVFG
jgi:preprotein translocase subunit SecE